MIVDEGHGYIDWATKLDILMKAEHVKTGRCDFALAKDTVFLDRTGLAFPKDSPWLDRFSEV